MEIVARRSEKSISPPQYFGAGSYRACCCEYFTQGGAALALGYQMSAFQANLVWTASCGAAVVDSPQRKLWEPKPPHHQAP
jgi:hypothetical protein